jgi:hypothetical protein
VNTFEYRIYYQWDGPSKCAPLASEKPPDEIVRALRGFPNELAQRLEDFAAHVETSEVREGAKEVHLNIRTTESRATVEHALVATLQDWDLYGEALHGSDGSVP